MTELPDTSPQDDAWASLRRFTQARIALGRTGVSVPVTQNLEFQLAHARARDAVHAPLDLDALQTGIRSIGLPFLHLRSQALDRNRYLQRPDLGRRLDADSRAAILSFPALSSFDLCIAIADGLSATAINRHALPLLGRLVDTFQASGLSIAPICLIENGRVAISDETGSAFRAKIALILIGERPGLSSPDSLGAYLTYAPAVGNTDAQRNCISNIRPEGLGYDAAATKVHYLVMEALRLKISGVGLKDHSGWIE